MKHKKEYCKDHSLFDDIRGAAAAVCLSVFIMTLAVVLVLNAGWLYRLDISALGLEQVSGLGAEEIWENYAALIRYNRLWQQGPLIFPTLPMSQEAAIHFQEVKRIFDLIQITCLVSGILSIILMILQHRKKQYGYLKAAGILTIAVPLVLGVLAFLDFDRFFITFHQLVFRNDYWLFDPATDPVILLLPEEYFFQCAAGILFLILAGSILCLLIYRKLRPCK